MASPKDLETLPAAFYVGKRKPLSDLSRWKRWLIRAAYFGTKWAADYGIEAQAICTDQGLAEEMCLRGGPNWFFHILPINVSLPDETVRYRLHTFPGSAVSRRYEQLAPPIAAVSLSTLREAEQMADTLYRTASK